MKPSIRAAVALCYNLNNKLSHGRFQSKLQFSFNTMRRGSFCLLHEPLTQHSVWSKTLPRSQQDDDDDEVNEDDGVEDEHVDNEHHGGDDNNTAMTYLHSADHWGESRIELNRITFVASE